TVTVSSRSCNCGRYAVTVRSTHCTCIAGAAAQPVSHPAPQPESHPLRRFPKADTGPAAARRAAVTKKTVATRLFIRSSPCVKVDQTVKMVNLGSMYKTWAKIPYET